MIKITLPFYEIDFSHKVSKKAYLRACKWLAINVISKVEISETTFNITKLTDTNLPTFKVTLYCTLDESGYRKDFCQACKQFHKSFFINQEYNCSTCKIKAYFTTVKKKSSIKKEYRKKTLNYLLGRID